MKLSTKGRYGVRAMVDLARAHGDGRPVLMGDIAERQGISRKYLHAILTGLREARLVESWRGVHGGYLLARPPEEINLAEIVVALEGPLALVDCVASPGSCERAGACVAHDVWGEASRAMESVLARLTLAEMVRREDALPARTAS